MFAAALIVFRESLEAALFVGIVAAATRGLMGRGRWLGAGVGIGVLGAMILAALAPHVSEWFDGLGQDMVNERSYVNTDTGAVLRNRIVNVGNPSLRVTLESRF